MGETDGALVEIDKISESRPRVLKSEGILITTFKSAANANEIEDYLTSFEAATVSKDLEVNVIFELEDDNALNRPPSTPVLLTPINGVENQELSVELTWESIDPEEDSLLYSLKIINDICEK